MTNIFLAPRSNETSHKNFESTIEVGASYSRLEPYLDDEEKKLLSKYKNGKISIWGNKESLRSRWEMMQPGDYVLFYAQGVFYYSARVVLTKYSETLGGELWPTDEDGKPWSCLFIVDHVEKTKIPIKVLQELADYAPTWDRVQGFMRLNDQGTKAIVDKFGSVENFLNQKPEVQEVIYRAIENVIEKTKEEIIEGEEEKVVDRQKLLEDALNFKDQGVSHIFDNTPHKVRVENRVQKKRVAALENYSCQICGWSLRWVNSKGKKTFRIDVDHIIDKAKGGGEELNNLWVLCPNCHVKKTLKIITVDLKKKIVCENGNEIKLNHDFHLGWDKN
jgi:HNH endonuclease